METLLDQLRIGDKYSYDDFEASVKERKNNKPQKKSIKQTVPFSNITYDFSKINGELYWEERELEYVFEITAASPEELEEKKQPFINWIMNVMNEDIYDIFIKGYHFNGTFESILEDDSEIEKSTITVKFKAYPYMIADEPKVYSVSLAAGVEKTVTIHNESSHRLTPAIETDVGVTIEMENVNYGIPIGQTKDDSFKLAVGSNTLAITSTEDGIITFTFYEEVF